MTGKRDISDNSGSIILEAEDITVGYKGTALFSPACFEVRKGECVLLCGANGSGKSTLLRVIAGISRPMSGSIRISRPEQTVKGRRPQTIPMVPSTVPKVRGFTLESFIRTGCYARSDWAGRLSPETEASVDRAISMLGLDSLRTKDVTSLSDGEFRKGCIASALTGRPLLVLLDEPSAFLDIENRLAVYSVLKDIAMTDGTAFLFSSHDLNESAAICDRVFAIGTDRMFRCSSSDRKEKNTVISSIFRNKSITFER